MGFDFLKKLGNSIQNKFKRNLSKEAYETTKNNSKVNQDAYKKEKNNKVVQDSNRKEDYKKVYEYKHGKVIKKIRKIYNDNTEIKKDKSYKISIDDNLIKNFNNISDKINNFVNKFNNKTKKEVNENLSEEYYDIYSSLFDLRPVGEKITKFDLNSGTESVKINYIISELKFFKSFIDNLHNGFINEFKKNKSYFKFWENLPNSEKNRKKNLVEQGFNKIKESLENLLNIEGKKLIECFGDIAKKKQIEQENEIKKQEEIRRKLAEAKRKEREEKIKQEEKRIAKEKEQQRYEKIENSFNSIDKKMSTFLEQYNLYLKDRTIENSDAPEEFYDIYNQIIDCLENNNSNNFDYKIYDLKKQEWDIKFDNDGNLEYNSAKELEIICRQLFPFLGSLKIKPNHVGQTVCDKLLNFYGNFYKNQEDLKKYFKKCYLNTKNIYEPNHNNTIPYEKNNSEIIKKLDEISEKINKFIDNYLLYKNKNKLYKDAPLDYYNIYIKLFDISEKIFNHDTREKFAHINKPELANLINAEKLEIKSNNIDNKDAYVFLVETQKMPKISTWFLNFSEIISEVDYKIVGDKIKKSIVKFTKILFTSLLSYFKDCYSQKIDKNKQKIKKSESELEKKLKLDVSFDKIIKKIDKFTGENKKFEFNDNNLKEYFNIYNELFDISKKIFKDGYPNNCRVDTKNFLNNFIEKKFENEKDKVNAVIQWLKKFDNILSSANFNEKSSLFSKSDAKKVELFQNALRKLY